MAKIKNWEKTDEFTKDVRRPTGIRKLTQRTYVQENSYKYLILVTMPRRTNFVSYGSVELDGVKLFEGSKNDAEDFAFNFMENYGNNNKSLYNSNNKIN